MQTLENEYVWLSDSCILFKLCW